MHFLASATSLSATDCFDSFFRCKILNSCLKWKTFGEKTLEMLSKSGNFAAL